jgi:glyoxylase-like metal-dependent hydrolase (beta-lactamase superfamily II)
MLHILDVHFHTPETIACLALEAGEGRWVIVDPGPYSTYPNLVAAMAQKGFGPQDVEAVLLTHIHFDHAGAAWAFAELGAHVYVHPKGYAHMQDPTKLVQSATRIYGDQMDVLWGKLLPIAPTHLHEVADYQVLEIGKLQFMAHYTPGHAVHHIAWQWEDHLFAGDVAGARIPGGTVQPPCPPPDIHLGDWDVSIERMRKLQPKYLYPTHFGCYTDVADHLDQLQERLHGWAAWVKQEMEAGKNAGEMTGPFSEWAAQQLRDSGASDPVIERYNWANPAFMSVFGLVRYWTKQAEG